MPVAPKSTGRTVSVRADSTAYQNTSGADIGAFNGGAGLSQLAQGIGDVGDAAAMIAAEDNERKAKELDIEHMRRRNNIFYGDGTEANPGFFSLKGTDALEAAPEVMEKLKKVKAELLGEARNGAVSRMFDRSATVRELSENKALTSFLSSERITANLAVSQARADEAKQMAASGFTSDDVMRQSLAMVEAETMEQLRINGLSGEPEVVNNALEAARTDMYRTAIIAAIKHNDPFRAREMLDAHKGVMDNTVVAELEGMVGEVAMLAEAQANLDSYIAQGMTDSEMREAARTITNNPLLRKETQSQVDLYLRQQHLDQVAAIQGAESMLYQEVYMGKSYEQLRAEYPEEMALIGKEVANIRAAAKAFQLGEEFADVSDREFLDRWDNDMSLEEKQQFNMLTARHKLTQQDWDRLKKDQEAILNSTGGNSKITGAYNLMYKMAKDDGREWNFGKDKQTTEQRQMEKAIRDNFRYFIQEYYDTHDGNVPSDVEMQEYVNSLFTRVTDPSIWNIFSDDPVLAEYLAVDPGDRSAITIPMKSIPKGMVDSMRKHATNWGASGLDDDFFEAMAAASMLGDLGRQITILEQYGGSHPDWMIDKGEWGYSIGLGREPSLLPRVTIPLETGSPRAAPPINTDPLNTPAPVHDPEDQSSFLDLINPVSPAAAAAARPPEQFDPYEAGSMALKEIDIIDDQDIMAFITDNEGLRLATYDDATGKPVVNGKTSGKATVGVGFNLDKPGAKDIVEKLGLNYDDLRSGKDTITKAQAAVLLEMEYKHAKAELIKTLPGVVTYSAGRQKALIDMMYNLGPAGFKGFKKMLAAIRDGDWNTAAEEAKDSKWYQQTGNRAKKVVSLLKRG